MLNREKIKEIMRDYPEVAEMSINEYQEFKKETDDKIPCMTSIYKYFGRWAEFKVECFENPVLHKWWETENNVIKAILEHPVVETMTELEYDIYREDCNLPTRKTIKKYIGTFKEMKEKVFNGIYEQEVVVKPLECAYCLQEDSCPYDYDTEECKYY